MNPKCLLTFTDTNYEKIPTLKETQGCHLWIKAIYENEKPHSEIITLVRSLWEVN